MLDVTPRHVRTLEENGVLKKAGPNKYDATACIVDYIQDIKDQKLRGILEKYTREDRPRVIELFENSFARRIANDLCRCKTRKDFDRVLLEYLPSNIFDNLTR